MSIQPFQGKQEIILERRTKDGALDFRGEQPPSIRCKCCGHSSPGIMTFDQVYDLYFRDQDALGEKGDRGTSASYEQLAAWLDSKGWSIRAKTW